MVSEWGEQIRRDVVLELHKKTFITFSSGVGTTNHSREHESLPKVFLNFFNLTIELHHMTFTFWHYGLVFCGSYNGIYTIICNKDSTGV